MRSPRAAQVGAVTQYSNALKDCQPSLLRQVYGASKSLIHKLITPTCLLCLEPGQRPALDLCSGCEQDLPRTGRGCAICAAPVTGGSIACHACLARQPAFDAVVAPYRYEFPLVELIHRLKYGGQVAVARILGNLLARRLAERGKPAVDALVPVPLHASREARRGYNQAGEIARFAGEILVPSSREPACDARARHRGAGGAACDRAAHQRERRVRRARRGAAARGRDRGRRADHRRRRRTRSRGSSSAPAAGAWKSGPSRGRRGRWTVTRRDRGNRARAR